MKIVSRYETADGATFEDKDEAKKHEAELEAITSLNALLNTSLQTGRPASILKHVLLESEEIVKIITKYHKRLPRKKIAA